MHFELAGVYEVAVVIGVPDKKLGEAVKAVVVRKPRTELTEKVVIDHCGANILGSRAPRSVEFVDALPKTMGKVLKKELRKSFSKT